MWRSLHSNLQTRKRLNMRKKNLYLSIPARRKAVHLPAARERWLCAEKPETILHRLGAAPLTDLWRQSNMNESIRVKWVRRLWVCIHRSIHHLTDWVPAMENYETRLAFFLSELTHKSASRDKKVVIQNSNKCKVVQKNQMKSEGVIILFSKNVKWK